MGHGVNEVEAFEVSELGYFRWGYESQLTDWHPSERVHRSKNVSCID